MSELKPNDPLVKEMLNDHLLVLVTKEAWILLNESRRTRQDLKAELVEAVLKKKKRIAPGAFEEVVSVPDMLRCINTIMGEMK